MKRIAGKSSQNINAIFIDYEKVCFGQIIEECIILVSLLFRSHVEYRKKFVDGVCSSTTPDLRM